MFHFPFVAQTDAPGQVLERQIKFGREQLQIQFARRARTCPATVKDLHRNRLSGTALLFEGNEDLLSLPPRPYAGLTDECKPELRAFRQPHAQQSLIPGKHLDARLREHASIISDDRSKGD